MAGKLLELVANLLVQAAGLLQLIVRVEVVDSEFRNRGRSGPNGNGQSDARDSERELETDNALRPLQGKPAANQISKGHSPSPKPAVLLLLKHRVAHFDNGNMVTIFG